MNIEVSQKMTLTIGSTDYEITTQEAEKLYNQIGIILGKQLNFQLQYPSNVRQPNFGTTKPTY